MKKILTVLIIFSITLLAQTHSELIDLGQGGVSGVSKDGNYVCGNDFTTPFIWSEATGRIPIGNLEGESFSVSNNGIVVGRFIDSSLIVGGSPVLRAGYFANNKWWGFEGIPGVPPLDGQSFTHSYGINSEGNKAVGMVWHANWRVEACYWSIPDTGIGLLGQTGDFNSRANAISNDGSIIAGWDGISAGPDRRAFYWDPAPHFMGGFDPTYLVGESRGMNSDGSVIVGGSVWPFIWTAATGMQHIVADSSLYFNGEAIGISDNGIIVGFVRFSVQNYQAFIKKPGWNDIILMEDYILDSLGITGYQGWYFPFGQGISADGNRIGLTAYPPGSGVAHALILTINTGAATTFQLSVSVTNGWNMVSTPGLNSPDQNVSTWWPSRDPGANVFKYAGGYQAVTAATPGLGYWMKHSGARTYNTGDEWPAGGIQIVAHAPLAGASGWNLIGGYELSVTAANVTTIPPGLQSGPIYKYSGGYAVATTLDPGYGYWIKLTGAGQIIIPETIAKGEAPVEYFPENWGKIVLTDATGISYTLYAVNGEVDLSQYELPPAPMAGMFDIRFSSGRIAEDINSSMQTIDMSGVTYPLTVRVDGMDMRLMDETGKNVNVNLKSGENVVISDATIQKLMVSGESMPTVYALEQNYPNPFNPSTVIEFSLPEEVSNVKLSIYNALGEKVAELVNTSLTAGKYQYQWNAQNVATGMYIYELRTDKFVSVKKMILLK